MYRIVSIRVPTFSWKSDPRQKYGPLTSAPDNPVRHRIASLQKLRKQVLYLSDMAWRKQTAASRRL